MLSVTISQIFIHLLSASGKLLTPKLESIDSEYDGNSTAAESQSDDLPQTVGSFINPLSDETDLTIAFLQAGMSTAYLTALDS
jgi:hypothetical protein